MGALAVSSAASRTCVVSESGSLYCFGDCKDASCGIGLEDDTSLGDQPGEMEALLPVDVGTDGAVQSVCTAYYFTCVLLDDGRVRCFGQCRFGMLGRPCPVGVSHLDAREAVDVDLGDGRRGVQISCTHAHTCVLLDDGTTKCFGEDAHGSRLRSARAFLEFISEVIGENSGETSHTALVSLPIFDLPVQATMARTIRRFRTGGHSAQATPPTGGTIQAR